MRFPPGQRFLFQRLHKGVLAVAVALNVVRECLRQPGLQCTVLPDGRIVRPQVIAHGEVPLDIFGVVRLKDVDLMRALVPALAQVAPSGNAEFPEVFVAELPEILRCAVDRAEIPHDRHDVEDRLGL